MTIQRVFFALTLVNLGLLGYQLSPLRPAEANTPPQEATAPPQMLRGKGIEIVDDQGRLRAQLTIAPANATFKMPDGKTGYPETVIFRLMTPDGKPRVKLTTSEEGSGLMLLGESDATYSILESNGAQTFLKLRNSEAIQKIVKP